MPFVSSLVMALLSSVVMGVVVFMVVVALVVVVAFMVVVLEVVVILQWPLSPIVT